MTVALDHPPAKIVQQLLVDQSLGTLPAAAGSWPINVDLEPDSPDNCITVIDTAGRMGDSGPFGKRRGFCGVQVRVRGTSHAIGYAKANAIAKAMDESIANDAVVVGTDVYVVTSLDRMGDIIPLGRDTPRSARRLFTINAQFAVRQTT